MSMSIQDAYKFLGIPFDTPLKESDSLAIKFLKKNPSIKKNPAQFKQYNDARKTIKEYWVKKETSTDRENVENKKAELEEAKRENQLLKETLEKKKQELAAIKKESEKYNSISTSSLFEEVTLPQEELQRYQAQIEELKSQIEKQKSDIVIRTREKEEASKRVHALQSQKSNPSLTVSSRVIKKIDPKLQEALTFLNLPQQGFSRDDLNDAVAKRSFDLGPVFCPAEEANRNLEKIDEFKKLIIDNYFPD